MSAGTTYSKKLVYDRLAALQTEASVAILETRASLEEYQNVRDEAQTRTYAAWSEALDAVAQHADDNADSVWQGDLQPPDGTPVAVMVELRKRVDAFSAAIRDLVNAYGPSTNQSTYSKLIKELDRREAVHARLKQVEVVVQDANGDRISSTELDRLGISL